MHVAKPQTHNLCKSPEISYYERSIKDPCERSIHTGQTIAQPSNRSDCSLSLSLVYSRVGYCTVEEDNRTNAFQSVGVFDRTRGTFRGAGRQASVRSTTAKLI